MSDPDRSAPQSGTCARCRQALDNEGTTGDLVCAKGCGRWISTHAIAELMPVAALRQVRANPFKATPFPVTRCLECKKTLEDLYAGDPAISFGLCEEHGVWLDRASREIFEAVFAKAIGANAGRRNTVDARVRELTQEVEALATKLTGDETVSRHELARRVVVLERALVEIAQRVERLERTNRGPG